jgi:hypothetical protein
MPSAFGGGPIGLGGLPGGPTATIGLGNLPGGPTGSIGPICGAFERGGVLTYGRWNDAASAPVLSFTIACNN